uniref:Uncharacterized protein n=1 Tax=Leersia perrieri TaxID=77586 RepID=A0A0D9VPY3_9ORYZ
MFAEVVEPGAGVFGNQEDYQQRRVVSCYPACFHLAFFLTDLSSGGYAGWMVQYPLSQEMGLSISYPPDDYLPMDEDTDRLFVRSLSFDNLSSVETLESPPAFLDSLSSQRLIIKESFNFKKSQDDPFHVETTVSMMTPKFGKGSCTHKRTILPRYGPMENLPPDSPVVGMISPKHQAAALRVQKIYKSFRTRRQLADCAVLVEQRWWKLLDFALLKRSSVSFFEVEKPESALSRWSRARTKAAKLSPSEGEEGEWLRLRSSHIQLELTEPGKPEKEDSAAMADDNVTATTAVPATSPATSEFQMA